MELDIKGIERCLSYGRSQPIFMPILPFSIYCMQTELNINLLIKLSGRKFLSVFPKILTHSFKKNKSTQTRCWGCF